MLGLKTFMQRVWHAGAGLDVKDGTLLRTLIEYAATGRLSSTVRSKWRQFQKTRAANKGNLEVEGDSE